MTGAGRPKSSNVSASVSVNRIGGIKYNVAFVGLRISNDIIFARCISKNVVWMSITGCCVPIPNSAVARFTNR